MPLLADFGLARLSPEIDASQTAAVVTAAGGMGTPGTPPPLGKRQQTGLPQQKAGPGPALGIAGRADRSP